MPLGSVDNDEWDILPDENGERTMGDYIEIGEASNIYILLQINHEARRNSDKKIVIMRKIDGKKYPSSVIHSHCGVIWHFGVDGASAGFGRSGSVTICFVIF